MDVMRTRGLDSATGGRTPAVALTVYERIADRERTRAAGFEAHLLKPVEPVDLVATIARLARAIA
jgi:CheY-like chemotaxis protein